MASHNCGTCFFFQEANFAGNGWCLHAERAKSADGRTLVRRNELACRNDWGRSLWTDPKAAIEAGATRNQISVQAERPATQGEIGFMVGARSADVPTTVASERLARSGSGEPRQEPELDGPAGEDVVVSQITFMAPGLTGHRRLVDQVPADIRPRAGSSPGQAPSLPAFDEPERRSLREELSPDSSGYGAEPRESVRLGRDRLSRRSIRPTAVDTTMPGDSAALSDASSAPVGPGHEVELPRRDDRGDRPSRRGAQPHPSAGVGSTSEAAPVRRPLVVDQAGDESAPEFLRGVRPAPIPGPVPTREIRRGSARDAERPAVLPRMANAPELDRTPDTRRTSPTPRPPLPRMASSDVAPDQSAPRPQRPVLPDLLPDDAFTPVTSQASPTDRSVRRDAGQSPIERRRGMAAQPGLAEGPNPAGRPNREPTPGMTWADPVIDQGDRSPRPQHRNAQAARQRPAVPRMAPAGARPTPPPIRSIPTVAEANRAVGHQTEAESDDRPAERSRSSGLHRNESPPIQDQATPRDRIDRSGTADRSSHESASHESAPLQPPTPLRPTREDFGAFAGWLDLQSVEPRLSPHLQRACETCRDFRPSENGERGWCANRDSFTLRTVVNAGDLPCISSFGCWWVPFDDVWLSEAAIRDHRNPTPLLDQLFSAEEQGVVSRQRRRS